MVGNVEERSPTFHDARIENGMHGKEVSLLASQDLNSHIILQNVNQNISCLVLTPGHELAIKMKVIGSIEQNSQDSISFMDGVESGR